MIAFFSFVTCGRDFKSVAESIKFVADLVGVDHVTLGSDWDGTINAFGDASHFDYQSSYWQSSPVRIGKYQSQYSCCGPNTESLTKPSNKMTS